MICDLQPSGSEGGDPSTIPRVQINGIGLDSFGYSVMGIVDWMKSRQLRYERFSIFLPIISYYFPSLQTHRG